MVGEQSHARHIVSFQVRAATLVLALIATPALAESASTRTVPVTTGAGEFVLRVYPPTGSSVSKSSIDPDASGPIIPAHPATEVAHPASEPASPASKPLILVISGEGGWRPFDERLARMLADMGFWVGGVDAMKYFWQPRDDRHALASDFRTFSTALATTAGASGDAPLILAGFSFGADLAPWLAGAGGWGNRIRGLIMIVPDETGSLEFRLSEILGFDPQGHTFSVSGALASAAGTPVLFVHGEHDSSSAAPALAAAAPEPKKLAVVAGAGHHFSGCEDALRAALRNGIVWMLAPPSERRSEHRPEPAPRPAPRP